MAELKQIRDKVRHVLKNEPATRNSDKRLIHAWIFYYHKGLLDDVNKIYVDHLLTLPSFDSITRARRLVQREEYNQLKESAGEGGIIDYEKAVYLPTDISILHRRRFLQEEYKAKIREL